MFKIYFILFNLLCSFVPLSGALNDVISITIDNVLSKNGGAKKRMPLFVGGIKAEDGQVVRVLPFLKADLELSKQFVVTTQILDMPTSKKSIQELYTKGYLLALFISKSSKKDVFEWRLYNTASGTLEKGRTCPIVGKDTENWAHALAHDIWQELMGAQGPFTSRLCYMKRLPTRGRSFLTKVCVTDVHGSKTETLFSTERISVAPRWSAHTKNHHILYSEFTPLNVRIVSLDMKGKKRVILDFDGTLAGVSFHPTSPIMVYGRSGGIWLCSYDTAAGKSKHTLVIKEKEACACPTALSNGDIIYCCQGKIKCYRKENGKHEILVDQGYTVGPAFHEKSGQLVYSKRVKGVMQLFLCTLSGKKHVQLTFNAGDKTDASWSPCGTCLAFNVETQGKSRIGLLHVKTGAFYYITPPGIDCCYPAWSSLFAYDV